MMKAKTGVAGGTPQGFERVTVRQLPRRVIMRVGGLEKNGKTHFALTAPAPLGILDLDRGLEGVLDKFLPTKEVYVKEFRNMPAKTDADHERRWAEFESGYYTLLASPNIRTVIVDTDTESWELIRMAEFGKLTQVKAQHYSKVNTPYRKLVDAAFDSDKNVIFIARYKKQYVKKQEASDDSAWNGKYEAAGFSELPFLVQVNLRSTLTNANGVLSPRIEVVNCRQNMQIAGEVFEDDMAAFPWVAASIVAGTSPEDWE